MIGELYPMENFRRKISNVGIFYYFIRISLSSFMPSEAPF